MQNTLLFPVFWLLPYSANSKPFILVKNTSVVLHLRVRNHTHTFQTSHTLLLLLLFTARESDSERIHRKENCHFPANFWYLTLDILRCETEERCIICACRALRRKNGGQRSGLSVPNAVRRDSRGAREGKTLGQKQKEKDLLSISYASLKVQQVSDDTCP